jgi:leader peptidase (prepilin peptidase)/N-methyltransferase
LRKEIFAGRMLTIKDIAIKVALGIFFFIISYLLASILHRYFFYLAYTLSLLTISYIDFRQHRIPNKIIYPLISIALGAMFHFPGWQRGLLGGVVSALCLLIPVLIYGPERAGMGDVKLAFFVGLILGFSISLYWALMIAFTAAAITGFIGILLGKLNRKSLLPFGPYLALGTIACLFSNNW